MRPYSISHFSGQTLRQITRLTLIVLMIVASGIGATLFSSVGNAQAVAVEAPLSVSNTSCVNNLLTNPGFENGVTGWSRTSGDTLAGMTSYVVEGSYSAYLQRINGNPAKAWQTVDLGTNVGGQTFSLTFYSGTHRPDYSHYAQLNFYSSGGSFLGSSNSVQVDRDVDVYPYTLQQYSVSGVAPANTFRVRVVFAASGDYMKLDGTCLTTTTPPTATPTHTPVSPTATATNTATPSTALCTNNLISNPGFENDVINTSPIGWGGAGKVGGEYAGFNTQDGTQYAYVSGNKMMWYSVASSAGKGYQATFYSGSHVPNPSQQVRLTFYDGSSNVLAQSVHNIVADMEVLGMFGGPYTLNIGPAPAGTTMVRFEVTDGGNDYAKIDGVCLRETTQPTPTATATNTPVPPTATATKTNTPVPPTATNTNTPVPPTATATKTNTPVPPTATNTNTPVPPTATPTNTITPASKLASLGNQVWYDVNKNGIQDEGSNYVAGVTVELLLNCTGTTVYATQTTDNNGFYTFYKLDAGQYRVRFSNLPAGYQFTAQDQGTRDTHDSDATSNGETACVTLAAGEQNPTVDAGIVTVPPTATATNTTVPPTATATKTNTPVPPTATPVNTNTPVPPTATATNTPVAKTGSLGNQVWYDTNKNGIQDDGANFVKNVQVQLLQGCDGNTVIATQITDDNGIYLFNNLPAGQYRVVFSNLPAGYQFTVINMGNEQADSDANVNGTSDCVTLAEGEHNPNVDAGIVTVPPTTVPSTATPVTTPVATPTTAPALASFGNWVWEDRNMNGLQDNNETGVSSVTIELLGANNNVIATTKTNVNGFYLFENLQPGDYSMRCIKPAGFTMSPANQGGDDAIDSDADITTMQSAVTNLVAGENDLSWDCGIYIKGDVLEPHLPSSLGNLVWQDFDQNGIQNNGEAGIGGVTVNLYNSQQQLISSTVTNANGIYWFHQLKPGDYIIEFLPPSGFAMTKDNVGDDTVDSDVTGLNNRTPVITLQEGEINPTIDAGVFPIPTANEQTNEPMGKQIFLPIVSR